MSIVGYGSKREVRAAVTISIVAAITAAILGACATIPLDTERTLERVTGGSLRVGITHNPPWTDTRDTAPGGSEADLAADFATELGADITWTVGSEAELVGDLHEGELDLAIGGFTDETPWSEQAAVTAPYAETSGEEGRMRKHVLLTRPGENGFLVRLESFLAERDTR